MDTNRRTRAITRRIDLASRLAIALAFTFIAAAAVADAPARQGLLTSPADLHDKRIAVLLGSAHVDYVMRTWPKATLLQYATPADLTLALKTGKADAALSDAEPLRELLRHDDAFAVLGSDLFSFPLGVGFRKGNTALVAAFDAFLARLREDGTHADMIRRWMTANDITMPDLPGPRPGSPLVVGISDGTLPYAAVVDGRLVGFEIELLERFGAHAGRPIRFTRLKFESLIAAVATGKVEMITSAIFITDERRQSIDFSAPFHEEATRAFALRRRMMTMAGEAPSPAPATSMVDRFTDTIRTNLIEERRYLLLLDGLAATVVLAALSALLGTALGMIICAARMSPRPVLRHGARIAISVLQGVPVLVLLMVVFYVAFASVDIDPMVAAVLAFGLNFAAYAAEIFRAAVTGVDRGQIEAAIAMGFRRWRAFRHVVLPQAVQRALPVYRGELVSLLKTTSVVGYIAVHDLTRAGDTIRSRTFDAFFPLLLVAALYFLLAWLLALALDHLERSLDARRHRRAA